ncbi:PucR family transcriptional regulator [Eubacterium ramulus]
MAEAHISGKKLTQALREMKEISRMDFVLFSKKGKLLASTCPEPDMKMQEFVTQFGKSMAESQTIQDWIFLKIEINEKTEHILLVNKNGSEDSSYVIGRMAACQIRNLYLSAQEPVNEANFLRRMLHGDYSERQIREENQAVRLKSGSYLLYVIRLATEQDEIVMETLKNLFVLYNVDYLVDVEEDCVVLIKNVQGMEMKAEQYARCIIDNLQTEAMINAWVGYSDPADSFLDFRSRYQQACTALQIGTVFYDEGRVFYYRHLGLGRIIQQLPPELCDLFLEEVLGEHAEVELDEETLATINQLFDNNLNISETARQLFIHRNTLVYRLERIEKKLGLDIRTFEDAMLFKIAMMVRTHRNAIAQEAQSTVAK